MAAGLGDGAGRRAGRRAGLPPGRLLGGTAVAAVAAGGPPVGEPQGPISGGQVGPRRGRSAAPLCRRFPGPAFPGPPSALPRARFLGPAAPPATSSTTPLLNGSPGEKGLGAEFHSRPTWRSAAEGRDGGTRAAWAPVGGIPPESQRQRNRVYYRRRRQQTIQPASNKPAFLASTLRWSSVATLEAELGRCREVLRELRMALRRESLKARYLEDRLARARDALHPMNHEATPTGGLLTTGVVCQQAGEEGGGRADMKSEAEPPGCPALGVDWPGGRLRAATMDYDGMVAGGEKGVEMINGTGPGGFPVRDSRYPPNRRPPPFLLRRRLGRGLWTQAQQHQQAQTMDGLDSMDFKDATHPEGNQPHQTQADKRSSIPCFRPRYRRPSRLRPFRPRPLQQP